MKQGTTLQDLATEIRRQSEAKEDYLADTTHLTLLHSDVMEFPELVIDGKGQYPINPLAHRQIGERLNIPAAYYDRMRMAAPDLLARNVNHWFQNTPEKRMLRTMDGNLRAFLSDRYRPMDNYDLAEAILPALADSGASVQSCDITETKMYVKAVIDGAEYEVPAPEGRTGYGYGNNVTVSPGIVISNSEVGQGALAIQPAVHFLACTNMAVWAQNALRKHHVGRRGGPGDGGNGDGFGQENEGVWEFLSDETKQLSDAALWSQVRDITRGALAGDIFQSIVGQLQAARGERLVDVVETVGRFSERKGLYNDEKAGVLDFLIDGGDLTRYGLSNAITRFSQDVPSYDRASWLEQLGGEVIYLPREDWGALVN